MNASELFVFLPKRDLARAPKDAIVHDVSSRAAPPFVKLSPFYPHGGVPVPGHPGKQADSVEGIWQGLKVIDGTTDESYLRGKGKKRRGRPEGHLYEGRLLSYIEARRLIYLPAYRYLWEECIGRDLRRLFGGAARDGRVQLFHDFDNNGDPDDPSSPLSHASVLVRLLQEDFTANRI